MTRNWKGDLEKYENFLKSVNLNKYKHLRKIKTVEHDLPKNLIPLDLYYKYYWNTTDFKEYEEVFQIYWNDRLKHIYEFIRKYFYGCSLQFVEEGFKARLYRIWVSVLTQFHFQYLWNALFKEKLVSSPELDKMGIDGMVKINNLKIGFQIKKISYRREVSDRRFTKKQQKYVNMIVEVPYLVVNIDEIIQKLESPRVKKKKEYKKLLEVFNNYFYKYNNGFVIFRERYLKVLKKLVLQKIDGDIKNNEKITYDLVLTSLYKYLDKED